ncbi:MAG: class I SAM-dependent rRNA methyltransferase [Clostridia bacterium]|jgi:23S rRNA (cytosine1962-C5)-methyltransferase
MPYNIYLKKNEEKRIVAGHPWVYANEVSKIEGKDKNGSLATVFDFNGRYIGKGFINHLSKILVRIFIRDNEEVTENLFKERILNADNYRKSIGLTDSYRMVFGESDNLPGLVVDKYGETYSLQFLTLGMDLQKDIIVKILIDLFSPKCIFERSDLSVREKEGLTQQKNVLYGKLDSPTEIIENGIKMLIDIENGQKTGYFLDQKFNRLAIRKYAEGKEVLDCFCNSGGFSLNAAKASAKSVLSLDISELALNDVKRNAEINELSSIIKTECVDVFQQLREYKKEGKEFDLIILDPPAFCKSASEIMDAMRGYKDINTLAMKLIRKGGFLATCSCSQHITFPLFEEMLKSAAYESKRIVRIVEIKTQSPDHPSLLSANETAYLKFYILNIL